MDSDPGPLWLNLLFALGLVLLNGFFAATEVALLRVRGSRFEALAAEGKWRAKLAQSMIGNVSKYISSCRMGLTMTSVGIGWLGGPAMAAILQPYLSSLNLSDKVISFIGFLVVFTVIVAVYFVISEQIPKMAALQKSEQVTLWSAAPIVFFSKLTAPFVKVLNFVSEGMLQKMGIKPISEQVAAHTEEEIRVLVKESHKSGIIDNTELTLVDNVFEFTETIGREIMIPRTEMACLYAHMSFEENLEIASKEMRTRYPVCDPDKDNIIGFVHIKDLLKASGQGLEHIRSITRPILSVPETMPISVILKEMQQKRTEIALLIDEYGGTSGLLTAEDILEELVGEIYDEFDNERPSIEKKDFATHSVDGLLHIEEFNEYFGLDIQTEDYDTIGGWMYSQLDDVPMKNQLVRYQEYEFIVDEVDNHRISRIIVRKSPMQSEAFSVVS